MRSKIAAGMRFCAISGLATTLTLSLAIEWLAGRVRWAALGVATFASARLKGLRAEPAVYLHWPLVFGYVVAPALVWLLIIWAFASAWKAVFA